MARCMYSFGDRSNELSPGLLIGWSHQLVWQGWLLNTTENVVLIIESNSMLYLGSKRVLSYLILYFWKKEIERKRERAFIFSRWTGYVRQSSRCVDIWRSRPIQWHCSNDGVIQSPWRTTEERYPITTQVISGARRWLMKEIAPGLYF